MPKFELIQSIMVVFITCKNEEEPIKNEGSRVLTRFSPLKVYGNFFKRSRAANSKVPRRIGPKFEFIQDIMVVLLTCKNEEDPIKNEGARVLTRLYIDFPYTRGLRTSQSMVKSRPKFKLIQAFMNVLLTCKNAEDPIKNEGARVLTRFLLL